MLTHNPIPGSVYNIGGNYSCEISSILDFLISIDPQAFARSLSNIFLTYLLKCKDRSSSFSFSSSYND